MTIMDKPKIGARVEGGAGDDWDIGTVSEPTGMDAEHVMANNPDNVFVRWDSGASTWAYAGDLIECDD